VRNYFNVNEPFLIKRNMKFSESVMHKLSINTKIIFSFSLNYKANNNQLLIDISKVIGANTYLCGAGASGYQKDKLFADSGFDIEYNKFIHPEYIQLRMKKFTHGLSIINALFLVLIDTLTGRVHSI
jgi:hypothetical protein